MVFEGRRQPRHLLLRARWAAPHERGKGLSTTPNPMMKTAPRERCFLRLTRTDGRLRSDSGLFTRMTPTTSWTTVISASLMMIWKISSFLMTPMKSRSQRRAASALQILGRDYQRWFQRRPPWKLSPTHRSGLSRQPGNGRTIRTIHSRFSLDRPQPSTP